MTKFSDLPKLHSQCEISPINIAENEVVIKQWARIIKDNITGETRLLSTIRVNNSAHKHGFYEHTAHIPSTIVILHRVPERPADYWINNDIPYKKDKSYWFNITEEELQYCTAE